MWTATLFSRVLAADSPLLLFKDSSLVSTNYVMEIWDNTNGLPQNAVYALEKDKSGYLWIATEEGLVRFDGISPKLFDKESYPIMQEQTYYTFFKTASGIWGTADRSIALLDRNILKVIDCSEITDQTWIRALVELDSGDLLIGTQSGKIFQLKDDQFTQLEFWNPERKLEVQNFFLLPDSKLLVGTTAGLYELDLKNESMRLISSEDLFAQKIFGEPGSIYVYSSKAGISKLNERYEMEQIVPSNQISDINPSSLILDGEKRIWAGSTTKGLILIQNGIVNRFTYPELANYTIRKIIKEKDNLYLGTLGKGLAIIKPAKVSQLSYEALREKNIKAIFQATDSSVWIGTRSDGVHRIKDGEIHSLNSTDGLLQNGVTTIGSWKDKIYVGSSTGISVIDQKSKKVIGKITEEDGLKSNYIYAVYKDSKDWLWILTRYGGIHYFDQNGDFHQIQLSDNYSNTSLISILELKDKQIVIGSMNQGIFWIQDGVLIKNQSLPLTPGENVVYCIYQDESDDLWFGTHGGIVLLKDEEFKILRKSNGIKSQSVYSITADTKDGVWITNNFGAQYFAKSELQRFKETGDEDFFASTTVYNKSLGMPNSEANGLIFPSSIGDFSGNIWIPTVEGVGVIDASNLSENVIGPANFRWDELNLGDQKTPIDDQIIIPEGVRMFQVSFSLIDFENPNQYSLFYRIDSKTEQWIPIKDQRQLIFNGLKPGEYTLEVKVLRYGKLDSIQTIPIQVTAALIETTAFKISFVIIILLLLYFVVKYYFNIQMKKSLESMVDKRTLELSRTNEKLKEAVKEIEDQNLILKEITWNQSHLVRAPLTKAMGINMLLLNYPKYSTVGKSKEELEKELLDTLKELDKLVKDTHSKSENLKK